MRLEISQSPGGDGVGCWDDRLPAPPRAQAGCSHPGAQHFYGWNGKKVLAEGPSGCMWAILKPWHSPQLPKHSGNLGSYKLRPSRVWFTPGRALGWEIDGRALPLLLPSPSTWRFLAEFPVWQTFSVAPILPLKNSYARQVHINFSELFVGGKILK